MASCNLLLSAALDNMDPNTVIMSTANDALHDVDDGILVLLLRREAPAAAAEEDDAEDLAVSAEAASRTDLSEVSALTLASSNSLHLA